MISDRHRMARFARRRARHAEQLDQVTGPAERVSEALRFVQSLIGMAAGSDLTLMAEIAGVLEGTADEITNRMVDRLARKEAQR